MHSLVDNGADGSDGLPQRATDLTDVCPKDLATGPTHGFLSPHARDPLGGLIERGDAPLVVNGKHTIVDGVEDDTLDSTVG